MGSAPGGRKPGGTSRPRFRFPLVDKTSRLYEQYEAPETFLVKILLNGMRSTVQKIGPY
jgi:hypothetical protein